MVLGTVADCVRWLRDLPREFRVSVAPNADAVVSALAVGACDWIAWPSRPTADAALWCTQVLHRRPLAAACTVSVSSGRLKVLFGGRWIGKALGLAPSGDGLGPYAARVLWLSAWAEMLAAQDHGGDGRDGAARDLLFACMIHPSTQPLEKALGVSKEYLELERKRLGRVGFRGPGRLSAVARVLLAWEGLRAGGAAGGRSARGWLFRAAGAGPGVGQGGRSGGTGAGLADGHGGGGGAAGGDLAGGGFGKR